MSGITGGQMRKIYALAKERGLDGELLHEYIFRTVGVNSIKKLNISQAVKVIDGLTGEKAATPGMMTEKQRLFIDGLLKDLGWTDESGEPDRERFNGFIQSRFNVDHVKWITSKTASGIIQGLKEMIKREKDAAAKKGEAI